MYDFIITYFNNLDLTNLGPKQNFIRTYSPFTHLYVYFVLTRKSTSNSFNSKPVCSK